MYIKNIFFFWHVIRNITIGEDIFRCSQRNRVLDLDFRNTVLRNPIINNHNYFILNVLNMASAALLGFRFPFLRTGGALIVISYKATHPLFIRMTIVRDRLSRHRELLSSSKVVFLSLRMAVERVTSAVIFSLGWTYPTLSTYLPRTKSEMRADALIGAI